MLRILCPHPNYMNAFVLRRRNVGTNHRKNRLLFARRQSVCICVQESEKKHIKNSGILSYIQVISFAVLHSLHHATTPTKRRKKTNERKNKTESDSERMKFEHHHRHVCLVPHTVFEYTSFCCCRFLFSVVAVVWSQEWKETGEKNVARTFAIYKLFFCKP